MKAIILAAGRGKRMMPLTKNTPKPLIKFKNITLIEHAINALKKANITQIVINVSYLGEQIQSYLGNGSNFGVQIDYSIEKTPLETAGGIIKALPLLGNQPFIAINSDIVYDYDLSKLALPKDALAHLILVDNPPHHPKGDFSLDNTRARVAHGKTYTFSGIGIYHTDLFKPYSPHQKQPLSPILNAAMAKHQISAEYYSGYWQDIGTIARLEEINTP